MQTLMPELKVLRTGAVTWEVPPDAEPVSSREINSESPTAKLLTMAVESGIIVYRSSLAMKDCGGSILLMMQDGTVHKGLTPERAVAWMSGWQASEHHSRRWHETPKPSNPPSDDPYRPTFVPVDDKKAKEATE